VFRGISALALLIVLVPGRPVLAQPASPEPAPAAPVAPAASAEPPASGTPPPSNTGASSPAEDQGPSQAAKEEAKVHFNKGISLLRQDAWAAALAEFLLSRQIYPTRSATNNAAIALRKLQRFDEALDMFEALLREFPNIPAGERMLAQRAVAELRGLVGTIEITGAEPGSTMIVSGQNRGEFPPVNPLRVTAGTHLVRVIREGFEPFETRADVAGGQTVILRATLKVLKQAGRLRVLEQSGKNLDVVVDGVTVGRTPWDGAVGVGSHTVLLRGEGKLGSQPATAPIKARELTSLTLLAEELDASMRVDPKPVGATVAIDSIPVGRGAWLGRLKSGVHRVDVALEGFLPTSRRVTLKPGGRELVVIVVERDPDAKIWQKPPKITFDLSASFVLAPSFGGDIAGNCASDCASPVGIGGLGLFHGGYELGSGLGFGLAAGYLIAAQNTQGRSVDLVPNGGLPPLSGTADEKLRLSAFVGGATLSYHLGERFPVLLRLGAGVVTGELRDERVGRFQGRNGMPFTTYPVNDFPSATYFYADPELRAGIRLGKRFELSLTMQAMILFALSQPRWDNTIELAASDAGVATYGPEALMGPFSVLLAPGLAARYDF
jgi:hypothetical protein